MGANIQGKTNKGIISTGSSSQNTVMQTLFDDLYWARIERELQQLSSIANNIIIDNYVKEAISAVEKKEKGSLVSASKKIGKYGLKYLEEASLSVLAEITARALME